MAAPPPDSHIMARCRLPRAERCRTRKAPREAVEQRRLATQLDRLGLPWLHVPNEGRRSRRQGADLKRQGLKPGALDNLILRPTPDGAPFVAIELKRADGTASDLTDDQVAWIERLRREGGHADWARGAAEALAYVLAIYWPGRSA